MPRLDRLLAHNLGLSRRDATRRVRRGLVRDAEGQLLKLPAQNIAPAKLPMTIEVSGEPVILRSRYHLLQHKPRGVVTALKDARHRTVRDVLGDVPMGRDLRAVGRLDLDTSGLLLWTTEGDLLHRLTHPRYAVPRIYHVAVRARWEPCPDGLALADGYQPAIVELAELSDPHPGLAIPEETGALATITLATGKFHEVRRIFAALGTEVLGLCRVAYGPLTLPPDLAPGEHIEVDLHTIFANLHPRPKKASTVAAATPEAGVAAAIEP
ncbi:MAG: pseudouridine synthase [Nannocystaceae bacterium]